MNEKVNAAASGADIYIWIAMFSILVVSVAYLAYKNKDLEK